MRTVRIRKTLFVLLPMAAIMVFGCNQEDWNWFGESNTSSNRRAGTKARRRVKSSADKSPAKQPAVVKSDQPKDSEDANAQKVEQRVSDHYASKGKSDYDSTYYGDELSDKIDRQSDPRRKQRIRQTANTAYTREDEAEPSTTDTKPPTRAIASDSPSEESARNAPVTSTEDRRAEPAEAVASNRQPPDSPDTTAADGTAADRDVMVKAEREDPARNDGMRTPLDVETKSRSNPPKSRQVALLEERGPSPYAAPASLDHDSGTRANAASEVTPKPETAEPGQSRPPALSNIIVSAGSEPEPEPVSPGESGILRPMANVSRSTPPAKDTFKQRIEDLESLVANDPNSLNDQFRLRMLYLVDGRDEDAVTPTPGMNSELAEIMQAHFRALLAARSETGRDASQWANRQLKSLESLRGLVRSRADLQVPRVVLCTSIGGYGVYEPIEPLEFPAGRRSDAVLYIEVDNYLSEKIKSGPERGQYRTVLTTRQSLLDADGKELWSHTDKNIEDISRDLRRDFFLSSQVPIPSVLPIGEYVLKVEVEDVLAGKINSNSVKFNMVVRSVNSGRGID
ncbi:MAG: hypothetical protein O7F76_13485 [Planctomycetota bacterium]|nr:hypothetical protein [Planctomycetota bacterium]